MNVSSFTPEPTPPTPTEFTITLDVKEAAVLDCILGWCCLGGTGYGSKAARAANFPNVAAAMDALSSSLRGGLQAAGHSSGKGLSDAWYAPEEN